MFSVHKIVRLLKTQQGDLQPIGSRSPSEKDGCVHYYKNLRGSPPQPPGWIKPHTLSWRALEEGEIAYMVFFSPQDLCRSWSPTHEFKNLRFSVTAEMKTISLEGHWCKWVSPALVEEIAYSLAASRISRSLKVYTEMVHFVFTCQPSTQDLNIVTHLPIKSLEHN